MFCEISFCNRNYKLHNIRFELAKASKRVSQNFTQVVHPWFLLYKCLRISCNSPYFFSQLPFIIRIKLLPTKSVLDWLYNTQGCRGNGNYLKPMGISCGFLWVSVGIPLEIRWDWALKFHSHGNPDINTFLSP